MTLMVHLGLDCENTLKEKGTLPDPSTGESEDERELLRVIKECLENDA